MEYAGSGNGRKKPVTKSQIKKLQAQFQIGDIARKAHLIDEAIVRNKEAEELEDTFQLL